MTASVFSPAIAARLVEAVRAGNTFRDAAEMAGIGEKTFERWRRAGRGKDAEEPYISLARDVAAAAAAARADCMKNIRAAAGMMTDPETGQLVPMPGGDWKASAWILEKLDWKTYDQRAVLGHEQAKAAREQALADLSNHQIMTHLKDIIRGRAHKDPTFLAFLRETIAECDEQAEEAPGGDDDE